jgi:hypothetical protein
MVFFGLTTLMVMFVLKEFLISRKYYLTFKTIVVCSNTIWTTLSMIRQLDVINTREPNPDNVLPYFIAVGHMLGMYITLMVAFIW